MRTSLLILAAGAGAIAYNLLRERNRRDSKAALKSEIGKWEGEGGQVPQVAPVSPVVTPASSVPDGR